MENTFKFKYIDYRTYVKDGTERAIITAWCSFGFAITLFTTAKKLVEIQDFTKKNNTNDITSFINVYYDIKEEKFKYNIKK